MNMIWRVATDTLWGEAIFYNGQDSNSGENGLFQDFFLMQLTASLRCRIHRPFRVCISVLFSVFTDMCNDHQF